MPMLEGFMATSTLMLVRFRRWNEILNWPQPAQEMRVVTAAWHFARGMALSATGKGAEASVELEQLRKAKDTLPKDAAFGLNSAQNVLEIAEHVLTAKIALAGGQHKKAIEL